MNGQRFSTAFSMPVMTASPAAMPSEPAMKRKSCAAATISWPSSQPSPTSTASSSSVPALAVLSRSVYLRPSRNFSGSLRHVPHRHLHVFAAVEEVLEPLLRRHAHVVVGAGDDELVGFEVLVMDHLPGLGHLTHALSGIWRFEDGSRLRIFGRT